MYIDAFEIRTENSNGKDKAVIVVEKDENGRRTARIFERQSLFYFYEENDYGTVKTLDGKFAKKVVCNSYSEMKKRIESAKSQNKKTYESDISPVAKVLLNHYKDSGIPELNVAFFDIEVEIDKQKGFAKPSDPFSRIIAVSVYLSWTGNNITVILVPPTMTEEEALEKTKHLEDVYFAENEIQLLQIFFALIEDADIITGWNTGGYDIPYIVNRIKRLKENGEVSEKDLSEKQLCFVPKEFEKYLPEPTKRIFTKYGTTHETYDIHGRVHIDYLLLYRKHLGREMDTLSLDEVAEYELKEKKVEYEGNLYDLYLNDIARFIEYSKQDVLLVKKIDDKKRYIDLCNMIAHENCVTISDTLGSIAVIEQALIKLAHEEFGVVIPDRTTTKSEEENKEEEEKAAGAFVVDRKKGLHEYVCLVDVNSLYPSTIRSLNLSPETIYGQIELTYTQEFIEKMEKESTRKITKNEIMRNLFTVLEYLKVADKEDCELRVHFENNNETKVMTAKEIYDLIKKENLCISANGTLIRQDRQGLVPRLLEKWYFDRKIYKSLSKIFDKLANDGIQINFKKENG